MTISAERRAAASDLLERTLDMYRDLSVALSERIAEFKAGIGEADCKKPVGALQAHHRALQTVLDIEASLGIRNRACAAGGAELDLTAARAEILAKLAVWVAES
jgi:hypothetical protein